MKVNSNVMNLADYRGEVKPCPMCASQTPSAAMDIALSGRTCKLCLGQGFVAMCLNCDGTGIYKGRTVWDGGRNEHSSTCTPCGGSGVFPVRKPKDWKDPEPAPEPKMEHAPAAPPPPPAPPSVTLPPPITMQSGAILPGGVLVK